MGAVPATDDEDDDDDDDVVMDERGGRELREEERLRIMRMHARAHQDKREQKTSCFFADRWECNAMAAVSLSSRGPFVHYPGI